MSAETDPGAYIVPPRFWTWLGLRKSHVILSWLAAFAVGGFLLWRALHWFDTPPDLPRDRSRVDGNSGHVQIDFGGQWVMGRMVVLGHARELYHRQRQWEIAQACFPVENEPPLIQSEAIVPGQLRLFAKPNEDLKHDSDRLMGWFMGADSEKWRVVGGAAVAPLAGPPMGNPLMAAAIHNESKDRVTAEVVKEVNHPAIGGPLYPPIHAFFYAPLALIEDPQRAYQVFQVIATAFVFIGGLGIKVLTRGRIWWSIATLLIFLYPGTRSGLDLGQNPTVTLAIAIWGWALAVRGYNTAGGMVWGLFAFKPVWGLAFFLVPMLTGRWRFCLAMIASGLGLVLATLPFTGLQTWFDWLAVGKEAAALYNVNQNWIMLSRDLQGIPRRILHDFNVPETNRDTTLAKTLAWSLWGAVLAATAFVYLRYADRKRSTGVGIGFLFFAAYLTCYRFMYYDALLSGLGFVVLLAQPGQFLRTRVFGLESAAQTPDLVPSRPLSSPPTEKSAFGPKLLGYVNSFPLTILVLLMFVENSLSGMNLQATFGFGYYAHPSTVTDGATTMATPRLVGDTGVNYPLETYLVILVWLWCGWKLIRGVERRGES